jgi:hypothetical protein
MHRRILTLGLLVTLSFAVMPSAQAKHPHSPSDEAVQLAQETSDLLLAELFAALVQEFSETTPANVEQGKAAISLVFSDSHTNFRLVGELEPLGRTASPIDDFEEDALALALQGQGVAAAVDRVQGKWFLRRSVPLSNFDPSCVHCHSNFGPMDPNYFVGALMLKVPIDTGD